MAEFSIKILEEGFSLMRPLNNDELRARRIILEPEDITLGSVKLDPYTTDLVNKQAWNRIEILPDDVRERINNSHGSLVNLMYNLHSLWIKAIDFKNESVSDIMLDAEDEFRASLFNLFHGFYRQAASCLRNSLERMTIGTYCQVYSEKVIFSYWQHGEEYISFDQACDCLERNKGLNPLRTYLRTTVNDSLFASKECQYSGGLVRRIYSELSEYWHSRSTFTNSNMWQSNGAIYKPSIFIKITELYILTIVLSFLLARLCTEDIQIPKLVVEQASLNAILAQSFYFLCK